MALPNDHTVISVPNNSDTLPISGTDADKHTLATDEERLFAAIIQSSDDAIEALDLEGTVLLWNQGAEDLYGYTEQDMLHNKINSILPIDREEELKNIIERIKGGLHVESFSTKRKKKDGTIIDVAVSASPIRDDKNTIIGLSVIARPIADKEKMAQYARSLIESSLDPLVTISLESEIIDVNEAAGHATGISRDLMIGTDFSTYFTDPDDAKEAYEMTIKEGAVINYPLQYHHQDGHLIDVLYNASVYKDDKGNELGVFAATRDITELKKAEMESHNAAAYVRSLIESSIDPLIMINPEGIITDINHATEEITGIAREWIVGTDFSTYFTQPHDAREGYHIALKEGYVKDYSLVINQASGETIDVLYNASVYKDAFGKPRGVFASVRDNTKSEQAAQQLLSSNKDLESFSYSVSHDLRAPLRAIDGFSKILLEDYAEKLDDEGKRVIETIRVSTQQMGKLIDDLLAFSRLGRTDVKKEAVDMTSLAKTVYDELKLANPQRNIQFTNAMLPNAQGDKALLKQVWENLLSNAIKFTGKKEQAIISTGSMEKDGATAYYVKDNGAGFDMHYVDKLFGVFQRLHDSADFEGVGIGLSLMDRIIKKHGGKVWAIGAVDNGATFYFSLPK